MTGAGADAPESIQPYLNEIAERLWAGRAAVMVGAGFSKNAGVGFPDWNQLGDLFHEKAHGVKPGPSQQKYLNVLRLAEEVQAAIGRPALENLLRSSIPDLNVEPSDLHVELLELPWDDVFTTNYDTLLERASGKVVTRRYEPVVNKEDIPYADKPRIVKLHGSFPSERPFIITEEDYRRYPRDYALFVNTVQQALLENTFCLIGFSGDDPNFLQWTGWIRDNLGKDKTQKIYLVGVFDLSPARLQLLAERGVIVVNLSFFDGIGKHDHKKALGKFFEYIKSKKPNTLDWPDGPNTMYPTHGADCHNEVQKIMEEWRQQRHTYPGWLILPYNNRSNLWMFTRPWVHCFPDLGKIPSGLDIQYVFELIWRLERCLLPIFDHIAEYCEKLLGQYWPFWGGNPPANCQFCVGEEKFQDLPWRDIEQAWLTIALAMLRFYREEGRIEKWKEAETQIKALSGYLSAEQTEFLNYEGFLFDLFNLDLPNAKRRLENWKPNKTQPYWMTKRATALAELGLLGGVDDQIRLSLVESRKKSKNDTSSPVYSSISREAYQMLLLRYVRGVSDWTGDRPATPEEEQLIADDLKKEWKESSRQIEPALQTKNAVKPLGKFKNFDEDWSNLQTTRFNTRKADWDRRLDNIRARKRQAEQQKENARWDELRAFRCDPWNELKLFELILDNPPPKRRKIENRRGFDIGHVTRMHHLGDDEERLDAYLFLRFCEEVGLPFRIGNSTMATKTVEASLRCISQTSPSWAVATLARLGDAKVADSLFDRRSVYKLATSEADRLIQSYLGVLSQCRDSISTENALRGGNLESRLAQLLPEIISRLCCKCSGKIKHRIFEFIAEIYASPNKSNYRSIRNLTRRLIASMSESEQYNFVPDLLKIPFPESVRLVVNDEFLNPFLLLGINQKPECAPALEIQAEPVESLLRQAESNNPDWRRWAISSLVVLYNLQLIDESYHKQLASAIWKEADGFGLPEGTDFYKFAFLRLPHPEGIDPLLLFKKYVKETSFPVQKNKTGEGVSITDGNIPIVHEIIGANGSGEDIWVEADAIEILERLLEWWDADQGRLSEEERDSLVPKEFRLRFARMVKLLSEVVGPKLGLDSPAAAKTNLARLLKEMRERGLPTLEAEAASIHLCSEQKADIYGRINEALVSDQDGVVKDGLEAIVKMVLADPNTGCVESEPVLMLGQYLTWGPANSIALALWVVVRIQKNVPAAFSGDLEAATRKRLGRLLAETAYDEESSSLSFDEMLEIRRISSILAGQICAYYKSLNLPAPGVIEEWRKACLSPDEFSEIKNAWQDSCRFG